MKKVVKRIVNIIIDIIVILILAVSVLIVTLSLTSKSSGVPNIFGVAPLSVLSSSMEDTINIGDMILCEVTDDPSYEYEKVILLHSQSQSTVSPFLTPTEL